MYSPIKLSIARTLNQRQELKLMLKLILVLMLLYAGCWLLDTADGAASDADDDERSDNAHT